MTLLKKVFWHILYPFIKKHLLYYKGYKLFVNKPCCRSVVCHMTNSTNVSGLADRLKCFVSSYIIAKENNYDLKILHTCGFSLENYLTPNIIDWRISEEEVSYGLNKSRIAMILYKIPKLHSKIQQWHIYGAQNIIPHLPTDTPYNWHEIFWKLFKPSHHLSRLVEKSLTSTLGNGWEKINFIAVHVRFLDFLEKVESTKSAVSTTAKDREEMIKSVHATLHAIREQSPLHNGRILLFTDSPSFLKSGLPEYILTLQGNVGHISAHKGNHSITDKAFIDLFSIAKAKMVYNIVGPGLYASQFSEIGALIGNIPFIRINRVLY